MLAFVLLVLWGTRGGGDVSELSLGRLALFNVVPLASVPAAAGASYVVPWPLLGFPIAGLVTAGAYAGLVAGFFMLSQRSSGRPQPTLDSAASAAD